MKYCRNCVYNKFDYGQRYCWAETVETRNYYGELEILTYAMQKPKNADNECKDYKRKWYKFWIKKEVL